MKTFKLSIIITLGLYILFLFPNVFAGMVDIRDPSWWIVWSSVLSFSNPISDIESSAISIFWMAKLIIWWLLVIYIVYAWVMLIMSRWTEEEELSSSKRQIRYAIVWILFINIPWTLFNAFDTRGSNAWQGISSAGFLSSSNSGVLVTDEFSGVFYMVVYFLEVIIFFIAIFMFVLAWIQIIASRWKEEKLTEWKNKIFYWTLWIIFLWVVESWKYIAFSGSISEWTWLFNTLLQLALFFAWVTVIFFLTLAWYYAITSAWDEEKVKKAKSIVINTLIAILILISAYTFLIDLITL